MHQSDPLKCKCISPRAAIWPCERPELTHQSQGTRCVLNWISPVWVRLLSALCGAVALVLGGPGTGLEDKELWADTQSRISVLCSLCTRRNITHFQPRRSPPPSHTLSPQDTSPHTGVAITLSPDLDDPGCLTQKPPCFVPFSPFLFRERGRWGGKTGTQSKMAVLV